jgi:hypothetical protein
MATIVKSTNPNSKLVRHIVCRSEFPTKNDFITYCMKHNVNGVWSLLWNLFDFNSVINLYSPKKD